MATIIWHLYPLRKCDVIGKFSSNGTKVKITKLFKVLHEGVSEHMEVSLHAVQR